MKYFILLALLLVSTFNGFSAEKKIAQSSNSNVDMSQLGKIDQKTLDVRPKTKDADVDLVASEHKMKISLNCKTSDGREIKQGETDYETCLHEAKNASSGNIQMNIGK